MAKEKKTESINIRVKPSTKNDFKFLCDLMKLSQRELFEIMIYETKRINGFNEKDEG